MTLGVTQAGEEKVEATFKVRTVMARQQELEAGSCPSTTRKQSHECLLLSLPTLEGPECQPGKCHSQELTLPIQSKQSHTHAQRPFSQVSPDSIKLTVHTDHFTTMTQCGNGLHGTAHVCNRRVGYMART